MVKNLRRHERIPLFHSAVLESAATGKLACKIRDYCPGGMFVAWQDNSETSLPLLRDDHVEVHFASLQGQQYSISGRVARTFPTGAGLAFDTISDTVLEELRTLASRTSAIPHGRTSDEQKLLLETVQKRINQFFEQIGNDFISQADESLFIRASEAKTSVEQTEYLGASKALKAQRKNLHQQIIELLDNPSAVDSAADQEPASDDTPELSLIDKDEFESFLSVSAVIARTEPRLQKPLFEIEKRFSSLYGAKIDASNNPVGVARVFDAFSRAVEHLRLSPMVKEVLYTVLEEIVSPGLEHLYSELNELLKNAGILPELNYDEHQKQKRVDYLRQQTAERKAQQPPSTDAAAPAPADSDPPVAETVADDPAIPASDLPPLSAQVPSASSGVVTGGALSQHTQAIGQQLRQMQDYIGNLHAGNGSAPMAGDRAVPGNDAAALNATYSGAQIVEAISLMQQELGATWGHEVSQEEIPQRLQKVLRSHLPQLQQGSIGHKSRQSIELVNDLFDAFADDRFIDKQILNGLRHLQPTLYKLSLLDDRFIDNQQHSARKVINHLANLDPDDAQQQQLSDEIGRRINAEFDANPRIFDEILPQLEAATAARRDEYQHNLQQLVASLKQQQEALVRHGGHKPAAARKHPLELEVWIERARAIEVGDLIALKQHDQQFQRLGVAWIGPEHEPFVLVNHRGIKQATMTLQELALQLRKGNAVILPTDELPASDRALQQSLYRLQERLNQRSLYDQRTGLPNQKNLFSELDVTVTRAQLGDGSHVLCYLDFNVLSAIDRQWGEDTGNALLKKITELLRKQIPTEAKLASAGDDKFLILLNDYELNRAQHLAEVIITTLGKFRFKWKQQSFSLKTSVGLASIDSTTSSAEEVLAGVEQACSEARAAGAMCHRLYSAEGQQASSSINWEQWLTETLQSEEIALYRLQLQGGSESGDAGELFLFSPGVEENDRLHWPEQHFLQADVLLDSLKKLDRLLFSQVLAWMTESGEAENENVSFLPLNKASLGDARLLDWLLNELTETRVPPSRIGFRIDEQATLEHYDNASILIRTLSEFGCQFLLSGYGRNSGSSTKLKDLPIGLLGIDEVFVENLADSAADQALVKSICDIGHLLNQQLMAFASADSAAQLRELGVDYLVSQQNFLYLSDLEQTCRIV